jgi:hypothetical protein
MPAEATPPQRARINVKLSCEATSQLHQVLSATPGVLSVTQLFPDERDQELRCLYMVEVLADRLPAALSHLQHAPDVEFAEETAPRKLV